VIQLVRWTLQILVILPNLYSLCFLLWNQILWWVFYLHLLYSLDKSLLKSLFFFPVSNKLLLDWLLSLNICFLVTLLLVMAILTSTIWIEGSKTLGFTITCFYVGFTPLFLNIFYISLYNPKSMILCPMSPQI